MGSKGTKTSKQRLVDLIIPIDGVMNTAKLFTIGNQHSKWFIEAKLDIPNGFDLSKKVQINIS